MSVIFNFILVWQPWFYTYQLVVYIIPSIKGYLLTTYFNFLALDNYRTLCVDVPLRNCSLTHSVSQSEIFYLESIRPIRTAENFEALLGFAKLMAAGTAAGQVTSFLRHFLRHFVEVSKLAVILLSVYYVRCYLVYIYSMLWPCLPVRTMASAWLASTRAVLCIQPPHLS